MEWKLVNVVVLALLGCVSAEVARFGPCDNLAEPSACTVESVDITPCKDPVKSCALQKGSNSTIVFEFTPNFSASNLKTQVYSKGASFFGSDPLNGIDGCQFTTCPVVAGSKQRFNYQLYLGTKLPKGFYTIEWKLWDEQNRNQVCCFVTNINLKNKIKRKPALNTEIDPKDAL